MWYSNCILGRKHFLEVRKGKGRHLTTGQLKAAVGVPSAGGAGLVSQSPFLTFFEKGFGEGAEALAALTLCTVFPYPTASAELSCCQNSQIGEWKKERNEALGGVLAGLL